MVKITHQSVDTDMRGYAGIKPDLEEVKSSLADITTQVKGTDDNSTVLTYDPSTGNLIKAEIFDGSTLIKTTNITYDVNGNVQTVTDILDDKTVTTTFNYTSGVISSITKAVV